MLTLLLPDTDPRLDGDTILVAMVKAADPVHEGDTGFKIGIVNLDGILYRVAVGNRVEMFRVGDALLALGFVTERPEGVLVERNFQMVYDLRPVVVVPSFRPGGHRSRRR